MNQPAANAGSIGVGITPLETRRAVVVRLATLAEDLGYASFSVAEGWGHDAGVLLGEIAGRTRRIELGTGVLNVWGRSAASIAMLAAAAAEASAGRFTLGFGAGSPQLAEGLHGVPFRTPVTRLAATARQVRALLDGRPFPGPVPAGARPLRLATPPPAPIPLQLAALGPESIRVCGELGDAWVPFLLPRSGLKEGIRLLEQGAARAPSGRSRPQVRPAIALAVSPDPDRARRLAGWWLAFYLTSMGPLYAATLRRLGLAAAVDAVIAANPPGGRPTVPEDAEILLDELTITGAAQTARTALQRWFAAGADMPVLVLPPNRDPDELEHALRVLRPEVPG